MCAAIFISYRRSDAAGHAGRLFDRLSHWFDSDALFYDIESIGAGDTFPQRLVDGIGSAKVVLVLIGPDWADELRARCDRYESDFVRSEVEHALRCHAAPGGPKVIPVLLGGATPPTADRFDDRLRSAISPLLQLDMHSFQGKNDDWNHQFVRLRRLLEAVPGVPAPRYRLPSGAEPPPFRVGGQRVSRHFSDPDGRLASLHMALEASGYNALVSPVAIHGMGGVGKTQLALKYCHDYRDRYGGVWWLRAETDNILQLDAVEACHAVGASIREQEPPAIAFKRWLDNMQAGAPPWLLVFDNAEDPAAIRPFLPERGGHQVMVTSRNPAWGDVAKPIVTALWSADQGADFLAQRLPVQPDAAGRSALRCLAEALGSLPLALEQAAGFLDETGMTVAEYLEQVQRHDAASMLLDEGRSANGYERSVLATLAIALPRLDDAAAQLLRLLAFCAPEPVPESLFTDQPAKLPPALSAVASPSTSVAWNKTVAALRRFGLVERITLAAGPKALQVHRLTQEVVRQRLANAPSDASEMLGLLFGALPLDARSPTHWPIYAALAPHVSMVERWAEHVSIDRRQLCDVLSLVATFYQFRRAMYGPAREMFERVLTITRRDQGEEHADTLIAMNNLALALMDQGELARARQLQELVLAVSRRTRGEEHPGTLIAIGNLAGTLGGLGELDGARELLARALEVSRRTLGDAHPDTLAAMHGLASTLGGLGELGGARELQEQVMSASRRVFGEEHPQTLSAMGSLAGLLRRLGELPRAQALQEQVLTATRRLLGEEHADTLTAMNDLALTHADQGDPGRAHELQEHVTRVSRRVLGAEHPLTLIAMIGHASTLRDLGELAKARELQVQVLAARCRLLGEENLYTLSSMGNLSDTLSDLGDLAEARRLQEQVVAGRRRLLGDEHTETLEAMGRLAFTLSRLGDLDGTRKVQEERLAVLRRVRGVEHLDTLRGMGHLARTLSNQGDLEGSRHLGEQAIDGMSRVLGEEHPETLITLANLARTRWRAGEHAVALGLMQRAAEGTGVKLGSAHPDAMSIARDHAAMRAALGGTDFRTSNTAP